MTDSNAMPSSTEGSISNKTQLNRTTLVKTDKTGKFTIQEYYDQGWNDDLLVEHGYATQSSVQLPNSENMNTSYTLVKQPRTRLTKQQMQDGSFESASPVYDARAETRTDTLKSLTTTLEGIAKDECLILGTTEQQSCRIITIDMKANGEEGDTRSTDNFSFSNKPSLMLIDVDNKQCPYNVENPVEMIQKAVGMPFGCVVRSSTSTLSSLKSRVKMLEFYSCIFSGETPIHLTLL